MINTKRLALCSLLLALALTLHFVESLLPQVIMLPGIKMGLANIITMLSFITMKKREALAITVLRILIGSIFGGSVTSFIYSASGGIVAFLVLLLLSPVLKNYCLLSITAAIFHNFAQVFAAYLITKTVYVFWYVFPLTAFAVISGAFVGVIAFNLSKYKIIGKLK